MAKSYGLICAKTITIREAKRNNPAYRPHGLTALGGVAQARKDLDLTAEAISIVSKVLDDINDAGDTMDVDSGSGSGTKQILEDTLAACVKCLLQCCGSTLQALSDGEKSLFPCIFVILCVNGLMKDYYSVGRTVSENELAQLRSNIHRALKHGGKQVQISSYEELRLLLNIWASKGGGEAEHLRKIHGFLATLTGELLSCEIDLSVETVRRGRAEATASFVKLCQQTGREIDAELQKSINDWRRNERSGPVRQVLDQVIGELAPE
jgi:proteasome component ECM29